MSMLTEKSLNNSIMEARIFKHMYSMYSPDYKTIERKNHKTTEVGYINVYVLLM